MSVKQYYEAYWSVDGFYPHGGMTPELEQLLQAHVSPTARCLDVGCGDGGTSGVWLKEHAASYVGVDISENALRDARARGLDVRRIADAGQLPFPDGSVDVVVCVEVLEHLFEPLAAVREMMRVLAPGGVLIATVPNVAYWRRRVDLAMFGRWHPMGDSLSVEQPWRDPHIRFFNTGSLARLLTTAGFAPVKVGGYMGALLREVPYVRKLSSGSGASRLYRRLEAAFPALLGLRLYAVATRPAIRLGLPIEHAETRAVDPDR